MKLSRLGAVVASSVGLAASVLAPMGPASAAPKYPVVYSEATLLVGALAPDSPPPGANISGCKLSATHPRPVVLVHGTFENEDDNWGTLAPLLADNGYCVYTFNYGGPPLLGEVYGLGDIATSAGQLSAFVDQVLAETGATKVDLVGHSQGGMMPRYYLRFLGGAAKVDNLVGLAPSNHGTTIDGLETLASLLPGGSAALSAGLATECESCAEQLAGSAFLTNLNAGRETVPGVTYTNIESSYDEVVTPYTSAFLSGRHVTNILIQNQCATDFSGHVGIAFDRIALTDVLNALDPSQPKSAPCAVVPFQG
jgi:triacylglycerol esterase/lipase EstA (alpha/beta hydrolase family)